MTTDDSWRRSFLATRNWTRAQATTELAELARAGDLHRVHRGVYLPTYDWNRMDADARYRSLIHATDLAYEGGRVYSHWSAAALWGLPIIGDWPNTAHVVTERATGGRSRSTLVAHAEGVPIDAVELNGLRVTSLARTVVDIGRVARFSASVAMADFAMRPALRAGDTRVDKIQLVDELGLVASSRGRARCNRMIEFADGLSGSPGESISRVGMSLLGLPAPELQVTFRDAFGTIGTVDFYWPQFNLIGEFDGIGKYLREEFTKGTDIATVVLAEKRREDRLRAAGPRVTRWGWDVARSLALLNAHLRDAGLR